MRPIIKTISELLDGIGHYQRGAVSLGVLPAVALHGAGVGGFDEAVIFGGIGLIIGGLIFLSWRAGRRRKRLEGGRRRRR